MVTERLPDYTPARLNLRDATGETIVAGVGRGVWGEPSKPLSRSDLMETWGAVGTQFFAGILSGEEYVRELQGDRAIATYERMWRSDGQCAALMNVYLLPLLQATYSIQAAGDDPEDVSIAQETSDNLLHGMTGMTWHRFLRQLYLFRGIYGHYVGEKLWAVDETGSVRLKRIAPRLARTLYRWFPDADDNLDRIQQRVWVVDEGGVTGRYEFPIIPAQKLVVSTRNQIGNNFIGESLFRPCYRHYFYKDQLYTIDGIAAAKNAMGVPVMNEPDNPDRVNQKSDRQLAGRALASYQANERAYFLLPSGWKLAFQAVAGTVRNILPSIEHHDLLMARSFLAQFINVDSGGTLIAARDSSSFFLEALQSEAYEAADDVNPLLREMEEYNHQRDRYSTLLMRDLDRRNVSEYLRGVAALLTAKGLTSNAETENALRKQLNLPELPEAGTGDVVDTGSQGQVAEDGDAKAEREQAIDPEVKSLTRRFRLQQQAKGARAQAIVRQAHISAFGGQPEPSIIVPRSDGSRIELRKHGARWETYSRQPSRWAGWTAPAMPTTVAEAVASLTRETPDGYTPQAWRRYVEGQAAAVSA